MLAVLHVFSPLTTNLITKDHVQKSLSIIKIDFLVSRQPSVFSHFKKINNHQRENLKLQCSLWWTAQWLLQSKAVSLQSLRISEAFWEEVGSAPA